jgi:subtilisin family serine protease
MTKRLPLALLGVLAMASAVGSHAANAPRIALASGSVDPGAPIATASELTTRGDNEVYLATFPAPPTAAEIARLRRGVERVYAYLPDFTFLVRAKPSQARAATLGVGWVNPWRPAYKSVAGLADRLTRSDKLAQVMVHLFPEADVGRAAGRLAALGLGQPVGERRGGSFSRLRYLVVPQVLVTRLTSLENDPEVFFIELEGRRELRNDTTIWVGQSGTGPSHTTPIFDHGIHGEGQVVAILDTGLDADMCFFRDTTLGLPPVNACNGGTTIDASQRKVLAVDFLWSTECAGGISSTEWDTHDHGTHVAGTVAGDNFANLITHDTADGMAPAAKLVIQDGGLATDNCADLPGLVCDCSQLPGIDCHVTDLNPVFQQTYDQGARIHSNSWGDNENDASQVYSVGSQDADEFMWNHPDFLLFFAAGNAGPAAGGVSSPSTAKNVVSVGSTQRGSNAESMSSFSSCGFPPDGRIKPDITAPGSSIISANNDNSVTTNNCGTTSMSGTSMATPGAAGLGALVRQYYTEGFYPSGVATPGDAHTPSAALVKATLVSSAQAMTGATAIPSSCQGWGRVLLDNALAFPGDGRRLYVVDDTAGFATGAGGEVRSYVFTVGADQPFKATLVWTDAPSALPAALNLVNDLDIEVVAPDGTYLGNVFSAGQSATGGSADRKNNVEQVLRATPVAGTYQVNVRSFNIPTGPQPYALVVTGNVSEPPLLVDGFESGDAAAWQVGP